MLQPLQLALIVIVAVLVLVVVALLEIRRSRVRRENEEMFGTDVFDEKIKAYDFSVKEVHTLEKLVRMSKFENKDAVLNSASLFEAAVTNFYDFREVFTIRDETLAAVAGLREKLDFTGKNPLASIRSTRQFSVGDRVDVILENGSKLKHSEILWKNEKEWAVSYDGSFGPVYSFIGKKIRIRWTRPEDAVYSAVLMIRSGRPGEFIVEHSAKMDKQQLRRWVRESVDFPVEVTFADGSTSLGRLYDLSAGGILIGLPVECDGGDHVQIRFTLPSFGEEKVEIEILRNLGHKNPHYPEYFSLTASFTGAFGWTQERVLQYIFEVHQAKNELGKARKLT